MLKFLENSIEIFSWIKIVISPTLVGCALGYIAFLYFKSMFLGLLVALIGLIIGIIWATKVWKKHGTTNFLSKEIATPELNHHEKN